MRCTYCNREIPTHPKFSTCADAYPIRIDAPDNTAALLRRLECVELWREREADYARERGEGAGDRLR